MLYNSNTQLLQSYLSQLKSQLSTRTPKLKYQQKILELLITLQQQKLAYDSLYKQHIQTQQSHSTLTSQHNKLKQSTTLLQEQKQQQNYQIKAKDMEIAKLENEVEELREENRGMQVLVKQKEGDREKLGEGYKREMERLEGQGRKNREMWDSREKDMIKKIGELEQSNSVLNKEKNKLQESIAKIQKDMKSALQQKDKQHQQQTQTLQHNHQKQLQSLTNQSIQSHKKHQSQSQHKLTSLHSQLQQLISKHNDQKLILHKQIQSLQSKQKSLQQKIRQLEEEKSGLENSVENMGKELKGKEKEVKGYVKKMQEMEGNMGELVEELTQSRSELALCQQKRKQLQKRQNQLKRQLQQLSQQNQSQLQSLQSHKQSLSQFQSQQKQTKLLLQTSQQKNKQLQSQLYKNTLTIQQHQKQKQQLQIKIQYLQTANVKLNEKLVLEEKHRESLVRALVADKELVQVQNGKLMQLLEVRDAAINAVVEGLGDIGEIKMADIGSMAGSKEKWMALAKENFKDANVRRTAIDKYILQ